MATDVSTILPEAFRHLKIGPASSLADDSDEAVAARNAAQGAVDYVLEACDWAFASTLADLPEAVGLIADENLPHTYRLPDDCVRLRAVGDGGVAWRHDADAMRADAAAPLRVRYTRRPEDLRAAPQRFRDAVALRLAWSLSGQYGQTDEAKRLLSRDLDDMLASAKMADNPASSPRRYDGSDARPDWVVEAMR